MRNQTASERAREKQYNELLLSDENPQNTDAERRKGYGPELDHLFFRNGAIEITPDSIRFKPYYQLDFLVDPLEIMPFDFEMPCSEAPFSIIENPVYQQKVADFEEHKKDVDNYTLTMLYEEERDIKALGLCNRWSFDFQGKKMREWWAPLQVLRCFANKEYKKEEALINEGKSFNENQEKELQRRLVNILYSLGRPMFRYKGNETNRMPYISNPEVEEEGMSTYGGNGKSMLVNLYMGCACNVLIVNTRKIKPYSDIAIELHEYIHHYHRVIHWEDWSSNLSLEALYNYITSDFESHEYHMRMNIVKHIDSPGHVVTSPFYRKSRCASETGRIFPVNFSHYFHCADIRANEPERKVSLIMPGIRRDIEDVDITLRSQIIYIDAMAIQFCMRAGTCVPTPMEELDNRSRTAATGVRFMEWAERFFSNDWAFNAPIDFDVIFSDYVELCESSDDKKTRFAPAAFRIKIEEYCADMGYECNPDVCYSSNTEKHKKFMRVKTWCKEIYFDDEKVWGKDKKKEIRVMKQSNRCLFFCRKGSIPVDNAEVKRLCKEFCKQPDPEIYLDPDGAPVVLTEEEQEQWNVYMNKKQGV